MNHNERLEILKQNLLEWTKYFTKGIDLYIKFKPICKEEDKMYLLKLKERCIEAAMQIILTINELLNYPEFTDIDIASVKELVETVFELEQKYLVD